MRVYLGTTLEHLTQAGDPPVLTLDAGTLVHGRTSALAQWMEIDPRSTDPDDEDTLALAATQLAAGDSLEAIAQEPGATWRRVVACLDVPDDAVDGAADAGESEDPSELRLTRRVENLPVVCAFVDDIAAQEAVQAAAFTPDEDTQQAVSDLDLLWYDGSEIASLLPSVESD